MSTLPRDLQVFAQLGPYHSHIDLHMRVVDDFIPGAVHVVQPMTLKKVEGEDVEVHEPALRMHKKAAQLLMDELWRCGLRPSEGTGSAGSLQATERHLHDMQRIAFHLLSGPRNIYADVPVDLMDNVHPGPTIIGGKR